MKMKLTHSEFMELFNLFQDVAYAEAPKDMLKKLLYCHQVRIYTKLYNKAILKRKEYTLKLTEEEAIEFYLFWSNHTFAPASFVGNILNQANAKIHRLFI